MVSPRTFWVGMIVGLLSLPVVVHLYVIFFLTGAPGDSLEEDWEAKSQNWNALQAQHTLNRKLGWKLDVIEDQPSGIGPTTYVLTLEDKERQPIQGATVTLKAAHNAHYSKRQRLQAQESAAGQYQFEMQVPYTGRWQFEGKVQVVGIVAPGQTTIFTQSWTETLRKPEDQ